MTLKTGLATALVAAVVAALVTAVTLVVIWRVTPGVVDAPSASLDEKKIVGVVHDYLTKNPEILVEMTTELDKRQAAEQAAQQKKAISDNAEALFRSPVAHVAGNPSGDVSIVEFFDYNCGYCKRGLPDVIKLVETDPKVRVVFKELPILSKGSEEAAHVALAAKRQGKYWEIHRAMLGAKGHMDEASALKIAESLGLDMDKLKADMASPEVKAEIEKSEAR